MAAFFLFLSFNVEKYKSYGVQSCLFSLQFSAPLRDCNCAVLPRTLTKNHRRVGFCGCIFGHLIKGYMP